MSYRILTDSCCDLPQEQIAKLDISVVPLTLNFRGDQQREFSDESIRAMYAGLRAGETATTSAVNPEDWKLFMEPALLQGEDLLVLAFSSGLSTTYQSAVIAADELKEAYPQRKIFVVDTLCASLGQGLLVWYACKKRDGGMSLEELHQWCVEKVPNLCHWFTVDDLMYLKRGGRVSAATALVGTLLNIKPVLHVDAEGRLINVSKARGRKAAIAALADKLKKTGLPGENDTVFISHGDCPEDAEYLAELVRKECGVKNVLISYVGAVIGSHSGPGTLAFFFLGNQR